MRVTVFTIIVLTHLCGSTFSQDSLLQDSIRRATLPEISFKSEFVDFGIIEKASDGTREFEFTNTGMKPLLITKCRSNCVCVVPSWPQKPVLPGGVGIIKITYDTKKTGRFKQPIAVFSNAQTMTKIIMIKGEVLP